MTLIYYPEEIVAIGIYGKMIRGILEKLYMIDILHYTENNDNWGIGAKF